MKKPKVYISYAWEKQGDGSNWPPILRKLFIILEKEGYEVEIDIHSINYKESIKSFMQELGRGQFVVLIISEKYLKSINCMYEVLQLIKYPNFRARIFPILLDDAKIYDSKKILEYIKYWDSEITVLNQETKTLSSMVYAKPIFEDIEIMSEVRRIIASFGDTIGDMNVLTPHEHDTTNFNVLIESINLKFIDDNKNIDIELQNKELLNQNLQYKQELEMLKVEYEKQKTEIKLKDERIQQLTRQEVLTEIEEADIKETLKIDKFKNILGFNRNSTKNDIIRLLGKPTSDEISLNYNFNSLSYNDHIIFKYYKKSEKLMVTHINLLNNNIQRVKKYIEEKGIKDNNTNYLGAHLDKILTDFGNPSRDSHGNYSYDNEDFMVNFVCYKFNKNACSTITVQFFRNE